MDETARRALGEGEPWIGVRARANCAIGQVQVCRVRGCRNFRRNVINPAVRIGRAVVNRIGRLNDVVSVVGGFFGVSVADMRSNRRTVHVHRPRCIAVYLADRISGATRAEIGAAFRRDQTIVAMYCRAIERELSESFEQQRLLTELEQTVKNHWRMT